MGARGPYPNTDPVKACTRCKVEQPRENFSPRSPAGNGELQSWCKSCTAEYKIEYNRIANESRASRKLNNACFEALLILQDGVCAICKKPETVLSGTNGKVRSLSVDHNHKTGKIRGLLCSKCNFLIGHAEDDVEILQKSIEYLKLHVNR